MTAGIDQVIQSPSVRWSISTFPLLLCICLLTLLLTPTLVYAETDVKVLYDLPSGWYNYEVFANFSCPHFPVLLYLSNHAPRGENCEEEMSPSALEVHWYDTASLSIHYTTMPLDLGEYTKIKFHEYDAYYREDRNEGYGPIPCYLEENYYLDINVENVKVIRIDVVLQGGIDEQGNNVWGNIDTYKSQTDSILKSLRFEIGDTSPDRVQIKVENTQLDSESGNIIVTGTVKSKSKITSSVFYRIEPGNAKQGYLSISGDSFKAEGEFIRNQTNVFKIVIDNEAKLSCETTLTFSGDGTLTGVQTTSPKGEVGEPEPVPKLPQAEGVVPGLGGVGNIPGPSSLTQGIIGVIIPALISILVNVFSGFGGGTGVAPPTPMPPTPPSTIKAPPKPKAEPPGPGPRPPIDPTITMRNKLDKLEKLAKKWNNKDLEDLVNKARKEAFGPDGKFDPNRWKTLNKDMINAVNKEIGKDQLGVLGQVGVFGKGAIGDTVDAAKTSADYVTAGTKQILNGVGYVADRTKQVLIGVGDVAKLAGKTILNPMPVIRSAGEAVKKLGENIAAEGKPFIDALKGGRYLDALKEYGKVQGKVIGSLAGVAREGINVAWESIKSGLPIDEIKSFTDPHASLEEKLWAVPVIAVKTAIAILPTKWAAAKVPGLGPSSLIPSVRAAEAGATTLAKVAEEAAKKAASLKKQQAILEQAAAKQGGKGGVMELAEKNQKLIEKTREVEKAAKATQKVEELVPDVLKGKQPSNFKEAQKIISENPKLKDAIDNTIKVGGEESKHLYGQRLSGAMSKDTHTLITARKLQIQEEIANAAGKRIIQEDVTARIASGEKIKGGFYKTMNSTEGSRTFIKGANVAVDNDMTYTGLKHVPKERIEQILTEECQKRGFTRKTADVNIYSPKKGLSDATGPGPNSEVWLQKGQQKITPRSGNHQYNVTKDGKVIVNDHVTGKGSNILDVGSEVDKPITLAGAEQVSSMKTQLKNVIKAHEKDNINQMVKYSARGIKLGHEVSPQTRDLIMKVASHKDPREAMDMLRDAGIESPDKLLDLLNMKPGGH